MNTPRASSQWERINDTSLRNAEDLPLEDFKSAAANHKIAIWDPAKNGLRYLKELIFNLCASLTPREWAMLRATRNRHIGTPYAIRFDGELVCLDYLQAIFEVGSMERCVDLDEATVLEIGAGYGRTCHTLLSNHRIAEYCIVDLANALTLARRYLKEVLPGPLFSTIRFVPVEEFGDLGTKRFDLCLNIDSFAEMDAETVHEYLKYIREHCRYFFTKNPVGKYLDKSLDGHRDGEEAVRLALKSGILKDIIDIYDNEQVRQQAIKFITAYTPGEAWSCIENGPGRPWSFYWQACYISEKR
jgi:hypothetical protein